MSAIRSAGDKYRGGTEMLLKIIGAIGYAAIKGSSSRRQIR